MTDAAFPVPPSSPIPFFDLVGVGHPIHFLHANGYPPACYRSFLDLLQTNYRVFGMLLRPLWPGSRPDEIDSWKPLSDDLLNFLNVTTAEPVIGVGHSIGAVVTLRAALQDPGKFRALVLIDPVLVVPSFMLKWQLVRRLGLGDRLHPLIPGAKRRRRTFNDLETLFRGYRNRKLFRFISDENLRALIEGITAPGDGVYRLVYPPEWEAQIYRTAMQDFDIWRGLPNLEVPALFLRGAETDTFLQEAARLVQRKQPRARVATLPGSTHLVPLERPMEVFNMMQSFLDETLKVSMY
jgi:pimeloyl-ACP methyl ester carboxylesterase